MIEVEQLVKRYGEIAAVDGVSFRVAPGEIGAARKIFPGQVSASGLA